MRQYGGASTTYPATVGLIDDSDAPTAANFNVSPQGLADRTANLNARIATNVASIAQLQANASPWRCMAVSSYGFISNDLLNPASFCVSNGWGQAASFGTNVLSLTDTYAISGANPVINDIFEFVFQATMRVGVGGSGGSPSAHLRLEAVQNGVTPAVAPVTIPFAYLSWEPVLTSASTSSIPVMLQGLWRATNTNVTSFNLNGCMPANATFVQSAGVLYLTSAYSLIVRQWRQIT